MAGNVFRVIIAVGAVLTLLGVLKVMDFVIFLIGGYLFWKYLELV